MEWRCFQNHPKKSQGLFHFWVIYLYENKNRFPYGSSLQHETLPKLWTPKWAPQSDGFLLLNVLNIEYSFLVKAAYVFNKNLRWICLFQATLSCVRRKWSPKRLMGSSALGRARAPGADSLFPHGFACFTNWSPGMNMRSFLEFSCQTVQHLQGPRITMWLSEARNYQLQQRKEFRSSSTPRLEKRHPQPFLNETFSIDQQCLTSNERVVVRTSPRALSNSAWE